MIPKEAIEKAIDGGWRAYDVAVDSVTGEAEEFEKIALDPTFWQALNKSLKWEPSDMWGIYAHEFYDLILTGGDTENFWKEILK